MRVFKTHWFRKFANKENISDAMLCKAVIDAEAGLIDADIGGGVLKQRVARRGAGKSGGYRTLIFFRIRERAVFAFGFAKNDISNISMEDQHQLKATAKITLGFTDTEMDRLVALNEFVEVFCNDNG